MRFKTILAVIQGGTDSDRVLDCAVPLATSHEAHLIGVHAEALPIAYSSTVGFPDAEFLQVASDANKQRSAALETVFRSRLAGSDLSWEWRSLESLTGDSALSAMSSARCADLVVVAQADPSADTAAADIDTLLFEAGRPVLVTPHAGPTLSSFRRILLAWNGSREAARAAFDALPFILEASHTEIFLVDPPEDVELHPDRSGADIAAALSRHGADVAVSIGSSKGHSVDDAIRNRLAETGADLLVAGAYSHSWLREFLFGGVTRAVLNSMPAATFLSR